MVHFRFRSLILQFEAALGTDVSVTAEEALRT